jgi:hypothetical protein
MEAFSLNCRFFLSDGSNFFLNRGIWWYIHVPVKQVLFFNRFSSKETVFIPNKDLMFITVPENITHHIYFCTFPARGLCKKKYFRMGGMRFGYPMTIINSETIHYKIHNDCKYVLNIGYKTRYHSTNSNAFLLM